MISNRKKETGPKTKDGKNRARRNALRHGLDAVVLREGVSDQAARLARFICADQGPKADYQQALDIAEAQMHLATVRRARAAALEGMLSRPYFEVISEIADLVKDAAYFDDIKRGTRLLVRAANIIRKDTLAKTKGWKKIALEAGISKEYLDLLGSVGPVSLPRLLTLRSCKQIFGVEWLPINDRLLAAAKFDRYQQRALSRRRRAIRRFVASSILAGH
jgi:hypothetical protein